MQTYTLTNQVEIPAVGFGTYKSTETRQEDVITDALQAGYRHFDTAAFYFNEEQLGNAFAASGIRRGELFLTSKVWRTSLGYEAALRSFEDSLKKLRTDYLDLLLIHWPTLDPAADWRDDGWRTPARDTWRAFEKLYEDGLVRAIGVSNHLPHHLQNLEVTAHICPMVNQLEYHPGYTQQAAVDYSKAQKMLVEAWSPLGRGRVMREPMLMQMAEKYGKSVPQLCLRFALQNGILPLPKSTSIERMRQNLDVFDFEISREDMSRLNCLPQIGWSGEHPDRARVEAEVLYQ